MAKKSKAEEIANLNNEVLRLKKRMKEVESETEDDKKVIERFNREKVNMLRESTVREDLMKKM